MKRWLNEYFRNRANQRILKQDAIFKVQLFLIRLTDESR